MSAFVKKQWRWLLGGTVLLVLTLGIFMTARVASFIGDSTGGGRTEGYLATSPTPDAALTATAQANRADLFLPTATSSFSTALNPAVTPTSSASNLSSATPAPTVNFNASSFVQKIKNGEPISMLVLGYGGNGHSGEWLTDTILVMRYDPKTKTISQFSLPRDLYVYVPYGGKNNGRWAKINTILASIMEWNKPTQESLDPKYRWNDDQKKFDSGVNLVADSVELVLGLRIDHWATLSFDGFRRLIDAMGGVEVNVERYFIDYQYPRNDDDRVDAGFTTAEFQAGVQKLSGEKAIEYSRSRHSETPNEGSDFARSRRQMRLISAVKEQVVKQNLVLKSLDFMQALQGKIRFSLDFGELTALANYFNSSEGKSLTNDLKFSSEVLDAAYVTDTTINGDYALIPTEGQGKYAAIQRWVQSRIANADIRREAVRVQVLNAAGGRAGLATRVTDFLLDEGFRMSEVQDGADRDQTELIDYTQGAAPNTIARLKLYLPNLKVTQLSPDKKPPNAPAEAGMQLFLGKDYKGLVNPGSLSVSGGSK